LTLPLKRLQWRPQPPLAVDGSVAAVGQLPWLTDGSFSAGQHGRRHPADAVIEKILAHLGLQARAPLRAPAREQALQAP